MTAGQRLPGLPGYRYHLLKLCLQGQLRHAIFRHMTTLRITRWRPCCGWVCRHGATPESESRQQRTLQAARRFDLHAAILPAAAVCPTNAPASGNLQHGGRRRCAAAGVRAGRQPCDDRCGL